VFEKGLVSKKEGKAGLYVWMVQLNSVDSRRLLYLAENLPNGLP